VDLDLTGTKSPVFHTLDPAGRMDLTRAGVGIHDPHVGHPKAVAIWARRLSKDLLANPPRRAALLTYLSRSAINYLVHPDSVRTSIYLPRNLYPRLHEAAASSS
jgi:hypothetical protein